MFQCIECYLTKTARDPISVAIKLLYCLILTVYLSHLYQYLPWISVIHLQSTPALRTPRYYGHPAITDSSKIPGESYSRLTEINSRYYGLLSLLRTYGHLIRSQFYCFLSRYSGHRACSILEYLHTYQVYFFCFLRLSLSFFGRFPLLLSINQNCPSSFSLKALFAVSLP